MDKEKVFERFLTQYLENVQKELPESFRAQQLSEGGMEAKFVYEFETRFLKEPFMEALKTMEK